MAKIQPLDFDNYVPCRKKSRRENADYGRESVLLDPAAIVLKS